MCGEAEGRAGTLAAIETSRPDLAIIELGLKNSEGLGLITDIRARHPKVLTLVLSVHDESLYAERSIRAGANGYISKREPPERIMKAVRRILAGGIYWGEGVVAEVASRVVRSARRAGGSPADLLSERELQVFELIGTGFTVSAIAALLHAAASTVESYRARTKGKLNLRNAEELLQAAIRWNVAKGNSCRLPQIEAELTELSGSSTARSTPGLQTPEFGAAPPLTRVVCAGKLAP